MSLPWPPTSEYEALEYEARYGLRLGALETTTRAPIQRRAATWETPARDELRAWLDRRKGRRPWRVKIT